MGIIKINKCIYHILKVQDVEISSIFIYKSRWLQKNLKTITFIKILKYLK